MGQNFGSNFLRGFQPNFANMFNDSYRNAFIQDERERERQEQERQKQEQLGILSQLFKGTKNVPMFENRQAPLMNAGQSFGNKEMPLSGQEQFDLRAKLSPSSALSFLDSMNKPQRQETVKVGNRLFLENPNIKGMPIGEPIFTDPQPEITEVYEDASKIPGLGEQYKGYNQKVKITKSPDGTITRNLEGNPFTWKKQTINVNTGSMDDDLSKETTTILNKYQKDQQDLMAKLESVKKGETVYEMTPWGFKTVVSAKDLENRLSSTNTQYQQFLKNNVDVETLKDWNGLKGNFVSNNPQSQPSIWATILQNYKDGTKDEAWFKEQIHLFASEYGYNPLSRFGIK